MCQGFCRIFLHNFVFGKLATLWVKVSVGRNLELRFSSPFCHIAATVPKFSSCTKYVGSPGRIHDRTPDCHTFLLGMDARMTLQLNVALIRKLRGPLECLAYFLEMSSMVVCTTRHLQTSGRLVQKLNVCTVSCEGAMQWVKL